MSDDANFNRRLDALLAKCGWPEREREAPGASTRRYRQRDYGEVSPEQEKPASAKPRRSCALSEVPPYCHAHPGMSPEESAAAAANAMGVPAHDSLARWVLLLAFRRVEGQR